MQTPDKGQGELGGIEVEYLKPDHLSRPRNLLTVEAV
jgi:hypothetical protein